MTVFLCKCGKSVSLIGAPVRFDETHGAVIRCSCGEIVGLVESEDNLDPQPLIVEDKP